MGVTSSLLADAPGIYFSVGIGDVKRLLRTPQGVVLPLEEWAKEQGSRPSSNSPSGNEPNRPREGEGPTLQDTVAWMERFSELHGDVNTNGNLSGRHWLGKPPENLGLSECSVLIAHMYPRAEEDQKVSKEPLAKLRLDTVQLNEIDDGSIEVANGDFAYFVYFSTSSPSFEIKRNAEMVIGGWVASTVSDEHMWFDSEENAKRFANALKHAVALCGGSKSAF